VSWSVPRAAPSPCFWTSFFSFILSFFFLVYPAFLCETPSSCFLPTRRSRAGATRVLLHVAPRSLISGPLLLLFFSGSPSVGANGDSLILFSYRPRWALPSSVLRRCEVSSGAWYLSATLLRFFGRFRSRIFFPPPAFQKSFPPLLPVPLVPSIRSHCCRAYLSVLCRKTERFDRFVLQPTDDSSSPSLLSSFLCHLPPHPPDLPRFRILVSASYPPLDPTSFPGFSTTVVIPVLVS